MIKSGEDNALIARMAGSILLRKKRIEGIGPIETPQWHGAITGGIWQPVRLVANGDIYVKDVFHRTENRGPIRHVPRGAGALDLTGEDAEASVAVQRAGL